MLLGQGLMAGFVLGIVATLWVQRRLRKRRLKLVGAPRSILGKVWGSLFGKPGDDGRKKGGRN